MALSSFSAMNLCKFSRTTPVVQFHALPTFHSQNHLIRRQPQAGASGSCRSSPRCMRRQSNSMQIRCQQQQRDFSPKRDLLAPELMLGLSFLAALPAQAEETVAAVTDFSKGSFSKESYYVTLGLFLISLPGKICGTILPLLYMLSSASFTSSLIILQLSDFAETR